MQFTEESIRDMLAAATIAPNSKLKALPGGRPDWKMYAFREERWRLAVHFERNDWWWCFDTGKFIGGLRERAEAYKWVLRA